MGFIGSSSARELGAQTDLPDPDSIDEIDYELEIELAAEESESESSLEDDAPDKPDAIPANNTSDLFEFSFREQARLAFHNRDVKVRLYRMMRHGRLSHETESVLHRATVPVAI